MRGLCYLAGVFFLLSLSFFTCLNAATGNPDECLATIEAPDEVCLPTNFQVKITMTSSGDQVHDVDVSVAGITCDYLPKKAKCPGETTIIVSPKTAGKAVISCLTATKNVIVITNVQTEWTVVQTGRDPLPPTETATYLNGSTLTDSVFPGGMVTESRGQGIIVKRYDYEESDVWRPTSDGIGTDCGAEATVDFEFSAGFDISPTIKWITINVAGTVKVTFSKKIGEPFRHVRAKGVVPYERITDERVIWESRSLSQFGTGPWYDIPQSVVPVAKTYFAKNFHVEKRCCTE